jgi:hypothetical protein
MSYSSIAAEIRKNVNEMKSLTTNVKSIDFDNIWSGDAHSKLTSNLEHVVSKSNAECTNLSNFATALDLLESYRTKKNYMDECKKRLSSLSSDEKYDKQRADLSKEISNLESELSSLKSRIQAMIKFSANTADYELVTYQTDTSTYKDFTYLYDFENLMQLNRTGRLKLFNWEQGKETLYDYYSKEYVDSVLAEIKDQYSGREAAVNCTLAMIQLAADVGKKLTYDGSLDIYDIGVKSDCAVFASWGVNQGTRYGDFDKKNVLNLYRSGTEYKYYEEALPGDVLVHFGADRTSYHAIFLVKNDTDNKVVTIAEAGGSSIGVRIREMEYKELQERHYRAVSMSQYYV